MPISMPTIAEVIPDSIAASAGVVSGWLLQSINGQRIVDILDYRFACSETALSMVFLDALGQTRMVSIRKGIDEDPGIIFTTPTLDRVRVCANHCQFCFVDQMPPNLRDSLYVKDDDYRLSFLSGSYLSLSNLRPGDLERIIALKLSPLYVSVQVFDSEVRRTLLGYPPNRDFWNIFDTLITSGIELHCQIVACPGYNDGAVLAETIQQLALRRPGVLSVTVVPVGLTRYRETLPALRLFNREGARELLDNIAVWSNAAVIEGAGTWIWAADEFYLLADRCEQIPDEEAYEGYQHLENGVGMIRRFLQEWQCLCPLPKTLETRSVLLITGVSGEIALRPVIAMLQEHLALEVLVVVNDLFGADVTVTGLLCGRDIARQIPPDSVVGKLLLLPDVVLREGSELFLDDTSLSELQELYRAAGAEIRLVPSTAQGLYQALFPKKRKPVRRMIP